MTADIVQFVPKANLNREAMIRDARANYERIFPSGVIFESGPISHEAWRKLNGYIAPESDPA